MKAVVLCAGFGTRMYPLTRDRAKPLLPVAGKPVVEYLVDALEATGHIDEILIVTNARFHAHFARWGAERVSLLNDGASADAERLGAVRDLAWAVHRRSIRESVLIAAGDNLFRNTLGAFVDDYRTSPRNLVAMYRERDGETLRRTGVAEIGADGRLLRLHEKPAHPPTDWACPALYILKPDALTLLDTYLDGTPEADALGGFIGWLAERRPVFTHEMWGSRLDVGQSEGYARAEIWLKNGV